MRPGEELQKCNLAVTRTFPASWYCGAIYCKADGPQAFPQFLSVQIPASVGTQPLPIKPVSAPIAGYDSYRALRRGRHYSRCFHRTRGRPAPRGHRSKRTGTISPTPASRSSRVVLHGPLWRAWYLVFAARRGGRGLKEVRAAAGPNPERVAAHDGRAELQPAGAASVLPAHCPARSGKKGCVPEEGLSAPLRGSGAITPGCCRRAETCKRGWDPRTNREQPRSTACGSCGQPVERRQRGGGA